MILFKKPHLNVCWSCLSLLRRIRRVLAQNNLEPVRVTPHSWTPSKPCVLSWGIAPWQQIHVKISASSSRTDVRATQPEALKNWPGFSIEKREGELLERKQRTHRGLAQQFFLACSPFCTSELFLVFKSVPLFCHIFVPGILWWKLYKKHNWWSFVGITEFTVKNFFSLSGNHVR